MTENPNKTWTITLNRYERDNLLLLLNICGYPSSTGVRPFTFFCNGDWIGQVALKLADGDGKFEVAGNEDRHHCNTSREAVILWMEHKEREMRKALLDADAALSLIYHRAGTFIEERFGHDFKEEIGKLYGRCRKLYEAP